MISSEFILTKMESNFLKSEENPIIVLIPCDSDSDEDDEDNISNKSKESNCSSDLIESSDEEAETIVAFKKISY